jgi:rhamnosyltransferase
MTPLLNVSIFIPSLEAESFLAALLPRLAEVILPSQIFIIDSSSTDGTLNIAKEFDVNTHIIQRHEFNHGKTRNLCLEFCKTEFLVFMTQDALPAKSNFLEFLLQPFEDCSVAATYARQLPRNNAQTLEQLDRRIKYPDYNIIQSQEFLQNLGARSYFLSNSCAAYRMSVFRELGGFVEDEIMGEDAIFAYRAISRGYKIFYASQSEVYHSHNYSLKELFKRYFDTGVYRSRNLNLSIQKDSKADMNQGSSYAQKIVSSLVKTKHYNLIPIFCFNLVFSFLGYILGTQYKIIPNSIRHRMSMHSFYWKNRKVNY